MIRNRRITLSVLTLTTLVLMLPAFPAQTVYAGPVIVGATVDVGNGNTFTQDVVNINVGEKVVWTLSSGFHTVTSGACPVDPCVASGLFDSGFMSTVGETFEFTFNTAGTFDYFCAVHGAIMTGQVVVTAQPPVCGDGIVNQVTEECDDLNLPTPTCDINCKNIIIVPPRCGDGIVNQPSEMCDDLNLPTPTCDINCQDIIVVPPCVLDIDCDDKQFCTLDSCVTGQCVFAPNPDPLCQRVGGEFIGVDSTALLLAGFQLNALWLLPAIAAIGIAVVVIRRIH